jgi:RND family efflux transporter MFP subunit
MKTTKYILAVLLPLLLAGCGNNTGSHGHSHDVIGGEDAAHDHAMDATTQSHTLFSDKYELFVEFPALLVGQTSEFAAHFTILENYKPLTKGRLTVSIIQDGKGLRHSGDAPARPGIFTPALQPKAPGIYEMVFDLESPAGNVRLKIEEVEVFASQEEAEKSNEDAAHADEVSFLKEQAWNADFETKVIDLQPFHQVIRTSGAVRAEPRSEMKLTATAAGVVLLDIVTGESVKKGDLIAMITGSGMENNLSVKLNESRIAFEKSRADYLRSGPLAEKRIIPEKDFLEIKARYQQDSLRHHQLARMVSEEGLEVTAPFEGIITSIEATHGDYLAAGEPIATLSRQDRLLIVTYVSQQDHDLVSGIFDANFMVPGGENTISMEALDGRVLAKTPFIQNGSTRIPVTFAVNGSDLLIPGMYMEAFLMTGSKPNALVVPLSALIEEQGQHFIYLQLGGETFLKQEVLLGSVDGQNAEIIQGLQAGDRIVKKGAHQIRLASLAGDLPLHGHTH